MRYALALAASLAVGSHAAAAQQVPAGRLIESARAQLEQLNPDSAANLLERALQPGSGATPAEQTRAFVLYGIAQLLRENVPGARVAFGQALQRDASLRVDSLAFFSDALERVFNEERLAVAPVAAPSALIVELDLPADTTLPVEGGLLRVAARPSRAARVTTVITPADDRSAVVWSDTAQVRGAVRVRGWNLRDREGRLVAPGRYALRTSARDSANVVSPEVERLVVVTRVVPDTQVPPPPLLSTAFAPETLHLSRGAPSILLWGASIGAIIAVSPSILGNPDVNRGLRADATAYAVAGGVTLASVYGFVTGRRVRALPQNIERNRQLRERDRQQREAIARANALARERADVRVTLERSGP